jgi:hypothetical protein
MEHIAKADGEIFATEEGRETDFKEENAKTNFLIRRKTESSSNVRFRRDRQNANANEPRIATDFGMQMDMSPQRLKNTRLKSLKPTLVLECHPTQEPASLETGTPDRLNS